MNPNALANIAEVVLCAHEDADSTRNHAPGTQVRLRLIRTLQCDMDSGEIGDTVKQLVGQIDSAVDTTTTHIRVDMERLRSVVRDATARLDGSFRGLQDVLTKHRDTLKSIADVVHQTNTQGQTFAGSAEALLQQFVEKIVRVSADSMRIMGQLSMLSGQVDGIVNCADDIDRLARETRFIAFNARIETHRAGEAGRTFKVVADEVKRLANASSTLSNQIRGLVSECRQQLGQLQETSSGLASHDMSQAVESHRGFANAIAKLGDINNALDTMLDRVDVNVAEAVRALQFEEVAAQLIATTMRRVEVMAQLSVRALWALERGRDSLTAAELSKVAQELRSLNGSASTPQRATKPSLVELS